MIEELIFTSAPRGLQIGKSGFCTVASTPDMSPLLSRTLEGLSGYRHVFTPGSPEAKKNPVIYSFLQVKVGTEKRRVLSRVADAGVDYSGRSNKLAHHVSLPAASDPKGGPTRMLLDKTFFCSDWQGDPKTLKTRALLDKSSSPKPCKVWKRVTGDAGWAGQLLEDCQTGKIVYLIVDPRTPVMTMLHEAISLLPQEAQWRTTFSTFYRSLNANVQCQIRCVMAGSPEMEMARGGANAIVRDLTKPLGSSASALADFARRGERVAVEKQLLETSGLQKTVEELASAESSENRPVDTVADGESETNVEDFAVDSEFSNQPANAPKQNATSSRVGWLVPVAGGLALLLLGAILAILFVPGLREQMPSSAGHETETDLSAGVTDDGSVDPSPLVEPGSGSGPETGPDSIADPLLLDDDPNAGVGLETESAAGDAAMENTGEEEVPSGEGPSDEDPAKKDPKVEDSKVEDSSAENLSGDVAEGDLPIEKVKPPPVRGLPSHRVSFAPQWSSFQKSRFPQPVLLLRHKAPLETPVRFGIRGADGKLKLVEKDGRFELSVEGREVGALHWVDHPEGALLEFHCQVDQGGVPSALLDDIDLLNQGVLELSKGVHPRIEFDVATGFFQGHVDLAHRHNADKLPLEGEGKSLDFTDDRDIKFLFPEQGKKTAKSELIIRFSVPLDKSALEEFSKEQLAGLKRLSPRVKLKLFREPGQPIRYQWHSFAFKLGKREVSVETWRFSQHPIDIVLRELTAKQRELNRAKKKKKGQIKELENQISFLEKAKASFDPALTLAELIPGRLKSPVQMKTEDGGTFLLFVDIGESEELWSQQEMRTAWRGKKSK